MHQVVVQNQLKPQVMVEPEVVYQQVLVPMGFLVEVIDIMQVEVEGDS
tara:strand:+ start:192 stop:335 length:144 start_codon:yes stop_codon:yes gene_type:complete